MSLRTLAENDLSFILEDKVNGFGWDMILRNPNGETQNLVGFSNDISQAIDPDTGQLVSGRSATVALRMSTLTIGIPRGITNTSSKPYVVIFNDINGNSYTFKVQQSNPDRTIGVITLLLEAYIDS